MAITVDGKRGTLLTAVMTTRKAKENTIHRYAPEAWRWIPVGGKTANSSVQPLYKCYWG